MPVGPRSGPGRRTSRLFLAIGLVLAGCGAGAIRCCNPSPKTACKPFKPGAEPCLLRGTRLVMMGDSITRFQYLDLVYRLEFGSHNDSFVRRKHRNPLQRSTWPSWLDFFRQTEAELSQGNETCSCHRSDMWFKKLLYSTSMSETRSYTWAACDVKVHFVMVNDGLLVRGHAAPTGVLTDAQWIALKKRSWALDWARTIRAVVGSMKPTALVLNAGLWPSAQKADHAAVRAAARNVSACAFWRTTTPHREAALRVTDAATRVFAREETINSSFAFRAFNISYLDDGMHFLPASGAYARLNELVLSRVNKCALNCSSGSVPPVQLPRPQPREPP